jgi:hypothetical protein
MRKGCRRVISVAGEEVQSKIGIAHIVDVAARGAPFVIKLFGHF